MALPIQKMVLNLANSLDSHFLKCLNNRCTEDEEDSSMNIAEAGLFSSIKSALELQDNRRQILEIKQICSDLRAVYGSGIECYTCEPLELVINIYLNCQSKHPVKRIFASTFQNYPQSMQCKIQFFMQRQIQTKLEKCQNTVDQEHISTLRKNMDMLASLLENFKLGEDCLRTVVTLAMKFLSTSLAVFTEFYSKNLSPVKQNETMHNCLVCLQTTNRALQKCHGILTELLATSTDWFIDISSTFVRCDVKLLEIDDFMLDCKCACGMNLTLLLKFNCPQQLLTQLLSIVFGQSSNIQEPVPALPWLQESGLTPERTCQLSSASLLCLFHGILAMLDTEDLVVEFTGHHCLLIDVFPDKFLQLGKLCADTSSKLLAGKCVYLWTTRAQSCLKDNKTSEDLKLKLQGQEVTMQKVLNFVWTTWEDTVDAIRLNARDVFTNILKIHTLTDNQESNQDVFLQNLATTLINDVSWSCKGKYGSLCSMVAHVGSTYFLSVKPSLPGDVLTQMKEQTLSCYASELYLKLSETHRQELLRLHNSMQKNNGWHKIWINPVLEVLSGTDKLQKLHVIEYVLPKLLKGDKLTLAYMIDVLTPHTRSTNQTGTHELGALITCLRRARGMGLLKCQDSESPERLYGIVDVSVVKDAVKHFDEQVRLDALALLCENQRTAELITKTEFDLLKCFLPWNLNNQSPSFRQYMLAHLKKLFFRMNESEGALIRNIRQKKTKAEKEMYISYLTNYQEFMTWTLKHLFHCIPGSSFARRTTCLSVLSLMIDLLGKNITGDCEVTGFDPLIHMDQCYLQSLMECLTDTFEENKQEATKILQYCSLHNKNLKTDQLGELFTTALSMAASPRPQDCTTAAYLFRVLLHTPGLYQHFKGADNLKQKLILSDSGDSFDLPPATDDLPGRSLMLLWILLAYLKDQKEVAKTSLIMAAANRPMYPTLHCIRYILFDVDLRSITTDYLQYWQTIVQDLILHCLEISEIVSPVVHNSSPEGNVPAETIRGPGLNFDAILQSDADKALMLEAEEKSKQTVMLMPEYLVVCCWRNIKEVSLLLGQLNLSAPITDPHNPQSPGLLSCDQIRVMGDYFTKQLLESKHRGAFELAYTGFVKMAEMLWKSNIPELHQLPQAWLQEVMVDIRSDDPNSRLCATRRSAGVPFYIQTLVTTEPSSTGKTCFKQAMTDLLQMALQDNTGRTTASNPQVHALNTLRALFKDTRLGEDVAPFIADGVKAAILGFQNPFWAVRNSATLLLSAMMTRVFGVKRSKDESNISRKNCQTGRAFFHRYPTLYKFLLDQLADATQDIRGDDGVLHLHPALYPVLMVLGRLFPSHLEGTDTTLNLAAFIPHIIRCSCSPVYKTRIMSAKALRPLVLHDQLTSVMKHLLHLLPDTGSQPQSHNLVHGVLLQIKQLLQMVPSTSDSCKTEIQGVAIPWWREKVWLISRENPCFITRTEALRVTNQLLALFQMDQSESMLHIQTQVHKCVLCEMTGLSVVQISFLPGFSEFVSAVANFALKHWTKGDNSSRTISIENLLVQCLQASFYDVRLQSLEFLCTICCNDDNDIVIESDTKESDSCSEMYVSDHKELKRIFENSDKILDQLIGMGLRDEKHHECVVKVFELLTHHPVFRNKKGTEKSAKVIEYSQILNVCLNVIEEATRDEMIAQVLYFTGFLITPVFDSISKGSAKSRGDNLTLIQKWQNFLTKYSGTEQNYQLQLSCIKVIGQNVHQLLQDPDNVLGDITFRFWTIVIDLLQEDDMHVKQQASQLMSRFLGYQTSVHPFLCLDILLSHMVRLHGRSRSLGCFRTLIMWIKGPLEDLHVTEERLFDKGEMNTYREDIIFIQLVTKHLIALLIKLSKCQGQNWTMEVKDRPNKEAPSQDLQFSTHLTAEVTIMNVDKLKDVYAIINRQFPSSDENCIKPLSPTGENANFSKELEATLFNVLCELERALQIDEKLSVSAPYLDVALFKSSITNIYRTLQLVGVARCLMSDNLTQICDSLIENIKYKLCPNKFIPNNLLSENVMYTA